MLQWIFMNKCFMQSRWVLHKFQTYTKKRSRLFYNRGNFFLGEDHRGISDFKETSKLILLWVSYSFLALPPHILNFLVKDLVGFPLCADKVPKDISLIDVTKMYVPPTS